MEKHQWLIWTLLLLVVMVTGCHRAPGYDSRLVAADSLMHDAPDSALAIIDAVSLDSLATEADHAYRDLLLTQARYRCYVTATSDSGINRALNYYRRHIKEREKLTRAYIYKGAVMNELGHPDSAMLYYKHAEATAAPDDYFNLGYANLQIAELYQSIYYNDSAVVARMRRSKSFFEAISDTDYLITTIGTQGEFVELLGKDSARSCLEKAVSLARAINSPKQFKYQSKLAGFHYYTHDYRGALDLSMDIVRNGKDYCNENQFYYYAARSYIKLGKIDSARWVNHLIPAPARTIDSMNYHLLMADLYKANFQSSKYAMHIQEADKIQKRIMKASLNSNLALTELEWNADQRETQLKNESRFKIARIIVVSILTIMALMLFSVYIFRVMSRRYRNNLEQAQQQLETMIKDTEKRIFTMTLKLEDYKKTIDNKDLEISKMNSINRQFHAKQTNINRLISTIVKHRLDALRDLNQSIRVKVKSDTVNKTSIPLISFIKDLYAEKRIRHIVPKESFWKDLKLSVDEEYLGIASFVEHRFSNLSKKDLHLFLLMCVGFPNQIIRICMDYTNDTTASKNKRKLLTEKMGLDVKLDEFIDMYLKGTFDSNNG